MFLFCIKSHWIKIAREAKFNKNIDICNPLFMAIYILNGQRNINQRILVTDRSELNDRKVYVFVRVWESKRIGQRK